MTRTARQSIIMSTARALRASQLNWGVRRQHVPRMDQDRPSKLLDLARAIAASTPDFQAVRGAGDGDRATHAFMRELRVQAKGAFGVDLSEKEMCGETSFAVDFYFPEESTVVEVALGLPNPASEFEKDILKALVARDHGHAVSRLVFISRAGAKQKCEQPGRTAFMAWATDTHRLAIEIHELGGEPRRRKRRSRRGTQLAAPVV